MDFKWRGRKKDIEEKKTLPEINIEDKNGA